jgi:hypothetical protein
VRRGNRGAEEIITVNQRELIRRQCFLNLKTIRKALYDTGSRPTNGHPYPAGNLLP